MTRGTLLLSVLVISLVAARSVSAQDVRNVSWGMTRDEVIEREGKDFTPVLGFVWPRGENQRGEPPVSFRYIRTLLGETVQAYFLFQEEKLIGLLYRFDDMLMCDRIRSSLEKKYGAPTTDRGMTYCTWVRPRTSIYLEAYPGCNLYYCDTKALQKQRDRQAQKDEDEL